MDRGGADHPEGDAPGARPVPPPPPPPPPSASAAPTGPGAPSVAVPPLVPTLPPADRDGRPVIAEHAPDAPMPAAAARYRSDQQRARSVYRRANPWYRRVMRGVIGLSILGAVGIGVYIGASELVDYLNRERLPRPGATVPEFRSTAFQITSSPPAPEIKGTLTVDVGTRAFEFVGASGGPQSGVHVVSPEGTTMYIRERSADWREINSNDQIGAMLEQVMPYLLAVDGIDDVLDNQMRNGYVDLIDKTVLGVDDDARDTYDMTLHARALSIDHPLQWEAYQDEVVPGATPTASLRLTVTVDQENVVVALKDHQNNWSWQRLAYSPTPFQPDVADAIDARVTTTSAPDA